MLLSRTRVRRGWRKRMKCLLVARACEAFGRLLIYLPRGLTVIEAGFEIGESVLAVVLLGDG